MERLRADNELPCEGYSRPDTINARSRIRILYDVGVDDVGDAAVVSSSRGVLQFQVRYQAP